MSGHSKWSKVKHQKAVIDLARGQAFTKAAHAITVAVREGGGVDPESNFRLRLAIEKARAVNMPKENIARAIERGQEVGVTGGIEQIIYEGYGPGGVAVMIEATTDNRQRTVAAIKNVFERAGGSLGSPGAVSFLFKRAGVITVPKAKITLDALLAAAIESGADDVIEREDMFEVYTQPESLSRVKQRLEEMGITLDNTELIYQPTTSVAPPAAGRVVIEKLIAVLEDLEDVQAVYSNLS